MYNLYRHHINFCILKHNAFALAKEMIFPQKPVLFALILNFRKGMVAMNFSHIKYVVEVENTGSITKAANNLYMGQPNLSKAIKELEAEIGITIFKRTAKGVEPTKKGAEFLKYAKTILSQINELESLYKAPQDKGIEFNVSIPRATYISVAFTKFLQKLKKEEQLSISLKETSDMAIINEVTSGESRFGIIRVQKIYEDYFLSLLKENGLQSRLLWEFETEIIMSKYHDLAEYETIPFHMLNGYIELVQNFFEVHTLPFSQIKRTAKMDLPPKRVYIYERGSQFDLLQNVHNTYMWVSPIPDEILFRHELVARKCSLASDINKDIIIYQKDFEFNEYEKLFLETVEQEKQKLIMRCTKKSE